jgi:hypothetical protein
MILGHISQNLPWVRLQIAVITSRTVAAFNGRWSCMTAICKCTNTESSMRLFWGCSNWGQNSCWTLITTEYKWRVIIYARPQSIVVCVAVHDLLRRVWCLQMSADSFAREDCWLLYVQEDCIWLLCCLLLEGSQFILTLDYYIEKNAVFSWTELRCPTFWNMLLRCSVGNHQYRAHSINKVTTFDIKIDAMWNLLRNCKILLWIQIEQKFRMNCLNLRRNRRKYQSVMMTVMYTWLLLPYERDELLLIEEEEHKNAECKITEERSDKIKRGDWFEEDNHNKYDALTSHWNTDRTCK